MNTLAGLLFTVWSITTYPFQATAPNPKGGVVVMPREVSAAYACLYTGVVYENEKQRVSVLCFDRSVFGRFVSIDVSCKDYGDDENSESLFLNARYPFVYKYLIRLSCRP